MIKLFLCILSHVDKWFFVAGGYILHQKECTLLKASHIYRKLVAK